MSHAARDWDAVLLDNYPDHDLPPDEDAALEKYVYTGGGLIFIAGDSNAKLAPGAEDAVRENAARPRRAAPGEAHGGGAGAGQVREA